MLTQQRRLDRLHDRSSDVVLNGKHIFHFPVVALRPEVITVGNVDQLCRNPQTLSRAAYASFKNGPNVQLAPNITNVETATTKTKCRCTRRYVEIWQTSQRVD